jgi:hypothetical protein
MSSRSYHVKDVVPLLGHALPETELGTRTSRTLVLPPLQIRTKIILAFLTNMKLRQRDPRMQNSNLIPALFPDLSTHKTLRL